MLKSNANYYDHKESERLCYSPLTLKEVFLWESFVMDERATQYFPSYMKGNPGVARVWIDSQMKRYQENSFGLLAVRKKENNEFVGQCGLLLQNVNGKTELEIGYHLLPRYWGYGYATEAAKKFKEIGFNEYQAESITSLIHPQNIPSQKVAIRNGMKQDGTTTHKNLKAIIFRTFK